MEIADALAARALAAVVIDRTLGGFETAREEALLAGPAVGARGRAPSCSKHSARPHPARRRMGPPALGRRFASRRPGAEQRGCGPGGHREAAWPGRKRAGRALRRAEPPGRTRRSRVDDRGSPSGRLPGRKADAPAVARALREPVGPGPAPAGGLAAPRCAAERRSQTNIWVAKLDGDLDALRAFARDERLFPGERALAVWFLAEEKVDDGEIERLYRSLLSAHRDDWSPADTSRVATPPRSPSPPASTDPPPPSPAAAAIHRGS